MEIIDEDDDLKLVKASAEILTDLEKDLPILLWRQRKPGRRERHVHSRVKKRHLDRITSLIEPFQGEPQLLDAKLKNLLPPIVDAYLDSISQPKKTHAEDVDLQPAVCCILYTLCKVRGYKVVVGFLNNEPKYLEPILEALEHVASTESAAWQVPYVLLLWLSHLLLTPFDLTSISTKESTRLSASFNNDVPQGLPPIITRVLRVGLTYLDSPTKAQDAAASLLVRLCIRPDVQEFDLAEFLVQQRLPILSATTSEMRTLYEMLGSLRLITGIVSSAELSNLVPGIYRSCATVYNEDETGSLSSNAVAKKLVVKIFRNIAILFLHSAATEGPLLDFLQNTDILESVIDYLLRSLGDKDTPVRYAAAKALSLIIVELDQSMAHEVIQAILDTFKEDIPRSGRAMDFSTVNPLKWHGLTLALSHTLFKRSASPEQLPDILNALISALQFQQRTATGSTLGTNVRDAANFGIWSLARRYTTSELLPVNVNTLHPSNRANLTVSIIQILAIQLILTACFDPAGNIRRGSSAALQELVGRHPDQIYEGIALVQIVDYQAVSLRKRAMINVANAAAELNSMYWQAAVDALFGWRGLGSADVSSREASAESLARLAVSQPAVLDADVLQRVTSYLKSCSPQEVENVHGYTITSARILTALQSSGHQSLGERAVQLLPALTSLRTALMDFSPRALRSELSAAISILITAICDVLSETTIANFDVDRVSLDMMDAIVDRMLSRHEEWILQVVPAMTRSILRLKRRMKSSFSCVGVQTLSQKVAVDGAKSTLHSAGRAVALGTLATLYDDQGLTGQKTAMAVSTLSSLLDAMNVEWRIIGSRSLQLVVESISDTDDVDENIATLIYTAMHHGLNDYTIDERGDVGSLVRLQSISCVSRILANKYLRKYKEPVTTLEGDIYRLSLEKLDRVRLAAAQCRKDHLELATPITDVQSVSSVEYFESALAPLSSSSSIWVHTPILQGCISSGGVGAETLLQACRQVLASYMDVMSTTQLEALLTTYAAITKDLLADATTMHPALELLGFLLDVGIPQRLTNSATFKWRSLLSIVQKSHHKSNDIPKILAAVRVYIGMADVPSIRGEVLKKLISMLKTNPYPRVRSAVAEALYLVTQENCLKSRDWAGPAVQNSEVLVELARVYLG